MIYNIRMKTADLLQNESAAETFERYLPGMKTVAASNPQAAQLSVEQLVKYTRNPKAAEILEAMDAALNVLNTPENRISPAERKLIERFQEIDRQDRAKAPKSASRVQSSIVNGKPWVDTGGEPIQAHGGAVIFEDGLYYWYGENKEHTDGKNGVWTWGIKVYSSGDLMNWDDRGYLTLELRQVDVPDPL